MNRPRRFWWLIAYLALFCGALLVPTGLDAEETGWFRLGDPGVVKADLDIQLYLDGAETADPGITLEEGANGLDYRWTDLPDVGAGGGTYSLTWTYETGGYSYVWPGRARAVLSTLSYAITTSPIQLGQGATVPAVGLTIRGLPEDPAGSTVTFSLWRTQGLVRVITDAAADIVTSGEESGGTWSAVVEHEWTTGETGSLSGDYHGRFKLTLPSSAVVWVPAPPGQLGVRVHALP